MKSILEFVKQELRLPAFYLGSFLWAMGIVCGEVSKHKKNLMDSGMASQDNTVLWMYNFAGLFVYALATVCIFTITFRLRRAFTHNHPSLWRFGISWAWVSVKLGIIVSITLLPSLTYGMLNYEQSITNPLKFFSMVIVLGLMPAPLWIILYFGAQSLIITRGSSYRAMRDSWKAFTTVWKETCLSVLLLLAPMLVIMPFRFVSLAMPKAELIAMGLNVAFAPYQFGMMTAIYLYLGKLMMARAPALAEGRPSRAA